MSKIEKFQYEICRVIEEFEVWLKNLFIKIFPD